MLVLMLMLVSVAIGHCCFAIVLHFEWQAARFEVCQLHHRLARHNKGLAHGAPELWVGGSIALGWRHLTGSSCVLLVLARDRRGRAQCGVLFC